MNWKDATGAYFDLGLSSVDKQLDIFFQPALSWSGDAKGIALFFLENNPAAGDSGQDFKRLVEGLVKWIWRASDPSRNLDTIITRAEAFSLFQDLYEQFRVAPFEYADLDGFLQKNFVFRIQECTGPIEGTIFPMFPQLSLKVGATPTEVFPIKRRGGHESGDLFSGQYLPAPTAGNSNGNPPAETKSAREFIFEDYGRLLLRSALQMVKNNLEKNPGTGTEQITIDNLLGEFDSAALINLAGMVSRFMLHGVRLDINVKVEKEVNGVQVEKFVQEEKGLYEATGQQFLLSTAGSTSDGYQFTVKAVGKEAFLNFPTSDPAVPAHSFTYQILPSESVDEKKSPLLALANSFMNLGTSPLSLSTAGILDLPFYREEPRLFALRKWVKWEPSPYANNPQTFLLDIPQSLQLFLQNRDTNPTISLFQIDPSTRPDNLTKADFKIVHLKYNWSTRINISVTRIPKSEGAGYLPDTYVLSGISEADINILESLLKQPNLLASNCKLHVLYAAQGGTTAPSIKAYPGTKDNFLLIRNNFSTNNPDSGAAAPSVEAKMKNDGISAFLQLLWEGATVDNGGYYFHLPSGGVVPAGLFDSGDTDQIFLVIEFDSAASDPIFDFHNNVILQSVAALDTQLVIAKIEDKVENEIVVANEKVPILNIPPGFFGFQLECDQPPEMYPDPLAKIPDLPLLANTELKAAPKPDAIKKIDLDKNTSIKAIHLSIYKNWVFTAVKKAQVNPPPNTELLLKSTTVVFKQPEVANTEKEADLPANATVLILEVNDSRIKIQSESITGWVSNATEFMAEIRGWVPKTQSKPAVVGDNLLLKSDTEVFKEATGTDKIPNLKPNDPVSILEQKEQRIKVQSGTIIGWVADTTEFIETVLTLPASPDLDQEHAKRELSNLYQLLGFQVGSNPNKLPIGPAFDAAKPTKWQYERLVPAYSLVQANSQASAAGAVPDPAKNPYNGIITDTDTKLDIEFWWQDVYGNKLVPNPAPSKPFPVKYTDPLIGINQWPSVTESYQFVRDDAGKIWLEIDLSFSTAGYQDLKPGGATARRLKADLETYTRIFYQMSQDDIDLTVQTTLASDSNWGPTFKPGLATDTGSLMAFILGVYQYLNFLYEFLQKLEQVKKDHEGSINAAIDTEIAALEPALTNNLQIEIEREIKIAIQAELEAVIIPQIIRALDLEAAAAGIPVVDNYETRFNAELDNRIAAELQPKIAQEFSNRTAAELPIRKARKLRELRDTLFETTFNLKLKEIHPGLSQDQNPYTVDAFAKTLNISPGPAPDPVDEFPLAIKNDFIQGLDASITISRKVANIHTELFIDANRQKGLDPKYQDVQKSLSVLSPKHESSTYPIPESEPLKNQSLEEIIDALSSDPPNSVTVENLVNWNQDTAGILKAGVDYPLAGLIELEDTQKPAIAGRKVTSVAGDTFNSLTARIKETLLSALPERDDASGIPEPIVNFSLREFAEKFKGKTGVFNTDTEIIISALNIRNFAANFYKAFPGYHLAVSEERNASPDAGTGNERSQPGPGIFLFAVHLGSTGVSYDIEEQDPNFYAIPPLTTTLFTGKVSVQNYPFAESAVLVEKEVNAQDMNVLARDFLVAFEDFLKPENLVPAFELEATKVKSILDNKFQLAEQISQTVMPILAEDNGAPNTADDRLREAQKAIRHKLRLNLVEGYDIEAIVQFQATVKGPTGQTGSDPAPRLTGRAKVLNTSLGEDPKKLTTADPKKLDYLITPGYFELSADSGSSSFSYLFDTKSPENFGNIYLEMEFEPLEIQFNLNKIHSDFLASDKLRFILPENLNVYQVTDAMITELRKMKGIAAADQAVFAGILNQLEAWKPVKKIYTSLSEFETAVKGIPGISNENYEKFRDKILTHANPNYMGKSAVPIPLRYYPQPPSLIFQRAEADDSSVVDINDLREWEYKVVYEHQDVAQDSIDCIVQLNILEDAFGKGVIPVFAMATAAALAAAEQAATAATQAAAAARAAAAVASAKAEEAAARTAAKNVLTPAIKEQKLNEAKAKAAVANTQALVAKQASAAATSAAKAAVAAATAAEALDAVDGPNALAAATSATQAKADAVAAQAAATQAAQAVDNLFDALVNFREVLPGITADLAFLREKHFNPANSTKVANALTALDQLSSLIAASWASVAIYNDASHYHPDREDLHYEISEEPLASEVDAAGNHIERREAIVSWKNPSTARAGIKPLNPLLDLPGFSREVPEETGTPAITNPTTFMYTEGNLIKRNGKTYAFDPHDYGDSSIPDRVFRVENLDVLQYQNAAASIWLSRNKNLVYKKDTNPAFIFQTPAVRFANRAIPFITNDEPFDIAALGSADGMTPQDRSLQEHMVQLLDLLEPKATQPLREDYRYEARLSCRFAFSLATGKGLNDDLVSTLPLLIGLRLAPADILDDQNKSQTLLDYPGKLRTEISNWFKSKKPVEEDAYLLFSLDIFSKLDANENSSLPMLRVKRLELKLKDINDMDKVRKGL